MLLTAVSYYTSKMVRSIRSSLHVTTTSGRSTISAETHVTWLITL
ncbi:hypothetical protein MM2B1231_1748 [Mycobacteroides abscessus subsp. bolletii 2B-1231]|uniref:Uncharacterized protein n=1 Tax=Mycobacteroides abscessus MAB_091912_2446 TaxID=1335414 RepID=A0A829MGK0_9MYCO|nr:hypothetical protein MM2B0626_1684 [Mycobacteroides abscessus subsp. bolletii 2B-0626]EIV13897.1 hypothetical protein MM2B0307_1008 [Mycobacteroides abscessus subsp. bolletii 2B-0307]EIV13956.1 hypothetical protein MM2B0912R_2088 [Mycobacteroides abscessus subsp. bolletii 2B-0912-R]EIV24092.1 hypothetical protein MM2B0912S_1689 [Mycobacteroides abscessus subsp. bolletii 2B-0912-S]EIV79405.1 hypothetical protein MM2B1231_1748 [Mycobacteroides abscessus subsp. bolletii 2B-1231]EIV81616.1 hypo